MSVISDDERERARRQNCLLFRFTIDAVVIAFVPMSMGSWQSLTGNQDSLKIGRRKWVRHLPKSNCQKTKPKGGHMKHRCSSRHNPNVCSRQRGHKPLSQEKNKHPWCFRLFSRAKEDELTWATRKPPAQKEEVKRRASGLKAVTKNILVPLKIPPLRKEVSAKRPPQPLCGTATVTDRAVARCSRRRVHCTVGENGEPCSARDCCHLPRGKELPRKKQIRLLGEE